MIKEPCNLIGEGDFSLYNLWTWIFPYTGLVEGKHFILDYLQLKVMIKFSKNSKKAHFWHIFPILGEIWIFSKNRALPLLSHYASLTPCILSRKTNKRILRKVRYGRTNGQTWIHGTLLQGGRPKWGSPPAGGCIFHMWMKWNKKTVMFWAGEKFTRKLYLSSWWKYFITKVRVNLDQFVFRISLDYLCHCSFSIYQLKSSEILGFHLGGEENENWPK